MTQDSSGIDKAQSVAQNVIARLQELIEAKGAAGIAITGAQRLGEIEIDSLKIVEIVFEMETLYRIEVDENTLQDLQTVNDLIGVIERACSAKSTC